MSQRVRAAFDKQAEHCAGLESPFMVRLMRLCARRLDTDSAVGAVVLGWGGDPDPSAESVPLRLAGALHALVIQETDAALVAAYPPHSVTDDALWDAVSGALTRHAAVLIEWLANAPQTNEVRRAAAVLPVLHMIAARYRMPVHLLELGTSGGLNLRCDQFCVRANEAVYGDADSGVALAPDWSGPAPMAADLQVARRAGVDLNPLDPLDPQDQLRLRAYLWADQPDRRARTDAAIRLAARHPAEVTTGDAIGWLDHALVPVSGAVRVVFHTVAWQYFPSALQARGLALLHNAGAAATRDAPLVHLSMEYDGGDGAALSVQHWPDGTRQPLARVDFHGRWLRWTGATSL